MIPADIKLAPLQVYVWQSQLNKGNDEIQTIGAPSKRYGVSSALFLSNHCWLTTLQIVQPVKWVLQLESVDQLTCSSPNTM